MKKPAHVEVLASRRELLTASGAVLWALASGKAWAAEGAAQGKSRPVRNVRDFGALGDGSVNRVEMLAALQRAWDSALTKGHDLYAPAGRYEIGSANFPWRHTGAGLLDCHDISIYGDGPSTVFATHSATGADAFQLNALKNLHFRNLRIAPVLSGTSHSGSNAISVTGGWDNLTFEDLVIENAPGVEKEKYIDGGKALSIQPGTTGNECGTLRARIVARGCVEAFGMDADLLTMADKHALIDVQVTAESCFRAFKYSAAGARGKLPRNLQSGITARVKAINCQQDVLLSRVHGIRVEAEIVTTKSAQARRLSPNGTPWSSSDAVVEALRCVYAKNAYIRITGDKGECDYKARLGGASAGSSGLDGTTEESDIKLDIDGTASESDVALINSGGNTVRASALEISDCTARKLPDALYRPNERNTVREFVSMAGRPAGCARAPRQPTR